MKTQSTHIEISGLPCYEVFPDDNMQHPAVIVIEEIWGLNDHIKDVCNRFAEQGYHVLSPELLHGEPFLGKVDQQVLIDMQDPDKRDEAQKKMRETFAPIRTPEFGQRVIADLKSCLDYLSKDGRMSTIGVLGFCFGGTFSFALAAADHRIKAAVPFYGQPLSSERVSEVACPILAFYGEQDTHLIETLPKLTQDMEAAGKHFQSVVYPNCGHAFFNDTNHRMYNAAAAHDAWPKVLAFLEKNLS